MLSLQGHPNNQGGLLFSELIIYTPARYEKNIVQFGAWPVNHAPGNGAGGSSPKTKLPPVMDSAGTILFAAGNDRETFIHVGNKASATTQVE
jgi:hypothetical protein